MYARPITLLSLFLSLILLNPISAEMNTLQTNEVVVLFKGPIGNIAQEVTKVYPTVRADLAETFRWEVVFRPEVVLVNNRVNFGKMVGNDIP